MLCSEWLGRGPGGSDVRVCAESSFQEHLNIVTGVRTGDLVGVSLIVSGVPMVVGVKTVKVLCSKGCQQSRLSGRQTVKNISFVKKENYQKIFLSCETGMRSSSLVNIELLIC